MKVNGSCHCGTITVEGEADPDKVSICHCTDCQTGTGSAFRVSVPIPGDKFKMSGQPTSYVKTTADSGRCWPSKRTRRSSSARTRKRCPPSCQAR